MAMGPRLEFRQTQSLVMTPQLRQAIKLLQFTNLEAAAFVEEELQRNPLLERDERTDAPTERPAPDQRPEALSELDAVALLRREKLPDAVEADHSNSYDAGGAADGIGGPGTLDGGYACPAAAPRATTWTWRASTTWRTRRAPCACASASSFAWASPTRWTAWSAPT